MNKRSLTLCYLADAQSVHTQRWVNYFADKGHKVHLLSFAPVEKEKIEHVRFYQIRDAFPFNIRKFSYLLNVIPNMFHVKGLLKKIHPDLVHAHEAVNYGRLAVLAGFHPLIITPWGTDIFIKSAFKLQKPITKVTLSKADLITCDGENTKKAI